MNKKTYLYIFAIALVVLIISIGSGKAYDREAKKRAREIDQNIMRCIHMGGVPIRSYIDGRLTNCIFKPERKYGR